MGKKTKIDWCDSTWNPVTGCLHGCAYCYARRIAERFRAKELRTSWARNTTFPASAIWCRPTGTGGAWYCLNLWFLWFSTQGTPMSIAQIAVIPFLADGLYLTQVITGNCASVRIVDRLLTIRNVKLFAPKEESEP